MQFLGINIHLGEGPGLVVMGGCSCFEGVGFESQHCKTGLTFLSLICNKNCNVCLKKTDNKQKIGQGS